MSSSSSPEPRPPGPEPQPPLPHQCCGTACNPCIWTYYHRARERWERRLAEWQATSDGGDRHEPSSAPC